MPDEKLSDSQLSADEQIETIWHLGGLTMKDLGRRTWAEVLHDDIFGKSSEIAYNLLFALFPMLLFLLAMFGLMATPGTAMRENVIGMVSHSLPGAAADLVAKTMTEVSKAAGGGKITLGVLLGLWTAGSGIVSMMSGLNMVYDIREARPFWKVRAIALALTIAIAVLTIAAMTIVLFGGKLATVAGNQFGFGDTFVIACRIIQWPLALFFMTLAFSLIYYYGPDVKEQHWYWITPGSLIGVVLWLGLSFAFREYLRFFNSYSKTYGSLGAVIILLMWFYVTSLGFLVGGEINSEIEHAAAERGHPRGQGRRREGLAREESGVTASARYPPGLKRWSMTSASR
jgi:membrane protein